mmetsp:Transcript_5636/g.8277  ORF Transcript_5636/g.8277 Transcript_5636/m.8277 type:complete len:567 (-) Transcript_5636:230-1930(-)
MEINASTRVKVAKKKPAATTKKSGTNGTKKTSKGGAAITTKQSVAPKLVPNQLASEEQRNALKSSSKEEQLDLVMGLMKQSMGEKPFLAQHAVPHKKSTAQSQGTAAADLAEAVRTLGSKTVLKEFGILGDIEKVVLPAGGLGQLFGATGGMKRISSASSLASFGATTSSVHSGGSSTVKTSAAVDKLKTASATAREGVLLVIRALCENVGRPHVDAFVTPFLAPVMEEAGSSVGSVREAAEDTAKAMITMAHPLAIPALICPVIFAALQSPEWRVKHCALQRLTQMASSSQQYKLQVCRMLPKIIPVVSSEVFDTKPQVAKAAGECLLATCQTNQNPDVAPAIPAVVKSIIKPSETTKAIDELMATTFVSAVDASTLSILCPVLSRGLKEKLAIHKRACSIVIENMSRLVDSPQAVAPFGPLLVPELKKVSENVQFEEIRDAALAALKTLTKALGHASVEAAYASMMAEETARVEEEERRIAEERAEELKREEEMKKKEEEERKQWKEAMEAQRLLDKLALEEEEQKKAEEKKQRELSSQSVKSKTGKCKGCGLKKCRKDCLFRT